MSIQLEVGKTYLDREGRPAKITAQRPGSIFRFTSDTDHVYRENGSWGLNPDDHYVRDLVAEAPTEGAVDKATPCPDVLDAKTYHAAKFLTDAADTMAERGKQYDSPQGERSMGKAVAAFNIITGQDMTEAQGWLFMSVLKKVRQYQGQAHLDSCVDDVAYTALFAEARMQEKK